MKNSLSLILLLAMTTLAFAQGKLALSNNTDNLIYFTTDTSKLAPADRTATADNGAGAGPFPIAGSGLYTGLGSNGNPGTIMSLQGSPSFVVGLWGGTSPSSMSLQTTTTIENWRNEGRVVDQHAWFTSLPAGTPAWFQIQVYDSRDTDANASMYAGHYHGMSPIFQATPYAVVFLPIYQSQYPVNSTWAPGTFPVADMVQYGPGYYGGIEVYMGILESPFTYTTNNGTITIMGYTGSGGDVTIPDTINGLAVTSIGDRAFYGWANLTSFTIPSSVTNIGSYAFKYCTSLTGVYFEGNAPTVGSSVFDYDENATVYYLPGTTGWGATFGGLPTVLLQYTYMTDNGTITITGYTGSGGPMTIPSVIHGLPVTTIGVSAFYNRYNITSVTIPTSVTSIEQSAFYSCTGLTNVTIGTNVTNIGDYALLNCSLTSVTIPASVTTIGNGPLGFCTNLTAITVAALNSAYSSVDGVLFNKSRATLIQCPGGKAGSYAVPNSVTSIADWAFYGCPSLRNVMIPNSVTNFGKGAFEYSGLTSLTIPNSITSIGTETFCSCGSLTNVMIPNGVTTIGQEAFYYCTSLTHVTIPASVTSIGMLAFTGCANLTELYFEGNAPTTGPLYLNATVYYLPETTGWGATFGGLPTALWVQVPTIQTPPQTQTAEATSAVDLWADASSPLPLFYLWRLNDTNLMSWSTNCDLELTHMQFWQSGAYTVVISNVLGTATSGPAMLNVIAAVERRLVPGVKLTGEAGSLLSGDYANYLSHAPNWSTLGSVSLTSTSQYYFDLTLPLPPQRYYRAWQTGTPGVIPPLDLHLVPAITLTGSVGSIVRLDYINQFGPTDAWVTLDTVTLTNTSQLYFDTSSIGQPARLWRIVPVP